MTPGLLKSIAGLIVAIMSFLGWSPTEYANFLPNKISTEIIQQEIKSDATQATTTKTATTITLITEPQVEVQKAPTKKPQTKPATQVVKKNKTTPTVVVTPKPIAKTPVVLPKEEVPKKTETIVTPPEVTTVQTRSLTVEEKIKASTVNIYCSRILGNRIQKTTGSGVIIDPSGVIITNSHVAEYFLLAENGNNTTCYIRTGSPASISYKAKLVYLPSAWVNNNKNNLSQSTLTGTGENDYALLVITERVSKNAENIPLTYLETSDSELGNGDSIYISGYPAGFSDVKLLDSALYSLLKPSEVKKISGFGGSAIDVINTGPTVLAEHGSSGGAVTDRNGTLEALIVATNIDGSTQEKNIQAITLPYIKRSMKNNSGKSFDYLVSNAREESLSFEKDYVYVLAGTLLGN